ncbi:MAG: filamentous hemagglutinin N-terminal domain-containing protein [Scytolyngbya sp. HA4215-MV1]|jgi:filamentous hemagglutinin family protein|nr:filamentous hemagglutinin N-terminal domain-containing protein [Scytolyngbya sp. HA4215-MV1]
MQQSCQRLWSVGSIALGCVLLASPSHAQIVPDNTLAPENTIVLPNQVIHGVLSDRIDGGAIRGANLFHSFWDFNVLDGRGAYFSNPIGIENILSRVTGGNPSHILGRLGVLGNANLFLLNPNGIVFGANASLDIPGSFTATTASGIQLGQTGLFSATAPQQSTLLAVQPGALFFNAVASQPSTIVSQGNLATGKDFTLAASNLTLSGQLRAGGNLTLQAADTLTIRDSATVPFVASAGGQLWVQGDRQVSIFALNHPSSGLFAGGNLTLRSANQIEGDAHFWAGGNFRIEQLNGNPGNFYSPYDPIIRAIGDVVFDGYQGASLHILAGGSVIVNGIIQIDTPDTTGNAISPTTTPGLATVTLSNGTPVTIDGTQQATLDIRAGMNLAAIGASGLFPNPIPGAASPIDPNAAATGAEIRIGAILLTQPKGLVLLTNQYQPNLTLPGSKDITVGPVIVGDLLFAAPGDSGAVFVDSRGNFAINDPLGLVGGVGLIDASNLNGVGGNVTILSAGTLNLDGKIDTSSVNGAAPAGAITLFSLGNIDLTPNASLIAAGSLGGNISLTGADISLNQSTISSENRGGAPGSVGGNIRIQARSLSATNSASISTGSSGTSEASSGNIEIQATDFVLLDGLTINTTVRALSATFGNGGNVQIIAPNITVASNSQITTGTTNQGNGGNIFLQANALQINNSSVVSRVFATGQGTGGNIVIDTGSLSLANAGSLQTATSGVGDAGTIQVTARGAVTLTDFDTFMTSQVDPGAIGRGGNISIEAGSVSLANGAKLNAQTDGQGNSGNISVFADNGSVTLTGAGTGISTKTTTDGAGGVIAIRTDNLQMTNGATLDASTSGSGLGGTLFISVDNFSANSGAQVRTRTSGSGNAGMIVVNVNDALLLSDIGTGFFADTTIGSTGTGGNISINNARFVNSDTVQISNGAVLDASTSGTGEGGSILLSTRNFSATSGGQLRTRTSGSGAAGNIVLSVLDSIVISDAGTGLFADTTSDFISGSGGSIIINTDTFQVTNGAALDTSTAGSGAGGSVSINTNTFNATSGGQLRTRTSGAGRAGSISVSADDTFVISDAGTGLFADTTSGFISGSGGSIIINTDTFQVANGAALDASTSGSGNGGEITIIANDFSATSGGQVRTNTSSSGNAGTIKLDVDEDVTIDGSGSGLFASAEPGSTGQGGSINIDPQRVVLTHGAGIAVNSLGSGNGGNIDLTAGSLSLDQSSFLSAFSANGQGGNITLNVQDILSLRRGSLISATAGNNGGGGNVTINAAFVLAFLQENSNITANAFNGPGGNITITTQGLFGFTQSATPTPLSDITASSTFGLNGTVIINTPDVDVQSSVTKLSGDFAGSDRVVAGSCLARTTASSGSFTVTGAGGLARTPEDPKVAGRYNVAKIRPLSDRPAATTLLPVPTPAWRIGDPVREAQGIAITTEGQALLATAPQLRKLASAGELICQSEGIGDGQRE